MSTRIIGELLDAYWSGRTENVRHLQNLPLGQTDDRPLLNTSHSQLLQRAAMEVTSFGLGVVAEVRTVAQSIVRRIENYRQGRETFKSLTENLCHLTESIEDVDNLLRKVPNALPTDIKTLFNRTFDQVHKRLRDADSTVEKDFVKKFAGSSSGCFGNWKARAVRAIRANSLNNKMNAVEAEIKEASAQLLQLTAVLANSIKIDSLRVNESAKEEYHPATSTPAVSHIVNLEFDSKDAEGEFATPEGALKHKVLFSISPETITAAVGKLNAAYGVVGMAGVGKTVALQGLAGDEDIRARFPDGIHYMSLGQEATAESVIQDIAQAMTMTGSTTSAAMVESSTSLGKAVAHACTWFHGKKCLFLIDDLWPTDNCPTGYLGDLRQLLRESPSSRMAISTRSVKIAHEAGYVVDFGAREPLGTVSVNMFMKYAACPTTLCLALPCGDDLPSTVTKILTWCGGLPIALSVTGSAVALLVRNVGSLERACEIYVTDFEARKANVGDEEDPQGTKLSDGIRLSLKYLDIEFLKLKERQAVHTEHAISDLYTSLCVLTNQTWIPVSVLSRMWQLREKSAWSVVELFCGLSLAALSFRKIGNGTVEMAGLSLHDLHLEFCKQQARSKGLQSVWHSALLNGYSDASSDSVFFDPLIPFLQQLVDVAPRSWWSIPEDGYIHVNLARHLLYSDQGAELAALLLDARWAHVRGKLGGILGLRADFEILDEVPLAGGSGPLKNIRKSFQLVFKAMQLSWGSFSDGQRAFQFQVCGRLLRLRNDDVIIDVTCKSFEAHTAKPYLMPVSRFFPEVNSAQILEIPVGGVCRCVTCSPCGRYIASGAGHDIVIADIITGDVLKRLKGHGDCVECIRFAASSKKIVSASRDRTVAVWEWEKSDTPILVLEQHHDLVMSVDVSSDGNCIVSGASDRTVRFWNGQTGLQTGEFPQSSAVVCVALRLEDKKVAAGLRNGTVKVLDSCTGHTVFEDREAHKGRVTSVAFSSDGRRMATCSRDKTIRIWDAEAWAAIGSPVARHAYWVTSVAFSPDGRQLVSGSYDGIVRLWDIAPAESIGASSNRPVLRERNVFSSDLVKVVTFTCDRERIISGSRNGIVRLWNASFVTEEKQRSFGHSAAVFGVSISPDGLRVATGSLDKTIRLWNTQTGAHIGIALQGHTDGVTSVSFSPDGRHLVSGSWDRTLMMWDTVHFSQIGISIEGHSDRVRCVSFSADGLRIVSGGDDKTVRLWSVLTHEQIGYPLIGHKNRVKSVSESSDGRFVVSRELAVGEVEREIIIWNRISSGIVWRSKELNTSAFNRITSIKAESIIRCCGHETPHLWPCSFPEYTGEIFFKDHTLYSSVNGEKALLGNLPSYSTAWQYDAATKVFTDGLDNGGIAICRLVV